MPSLVSVFDTLSPSTKVLKTRRAIQSAINLHCNDLASPQRMVEVWSMVNTLLHVSNLPISQAANLTDLTIRLSSFTWMHQAITFVTKEVTQGASQKEEIELNIAILEDKLKPCKSSYKSSRQDQVNQASTSLQTWLIQAHVRLKAQRGNLAKEKRA